MQIAELGEDDRTRILAIKEVRERIREALQTEGMMRQVEVVDTGPVGEGVRQVKSTGPALNQMLDSLSSKFKPKELDHE